MMRRNKLFDFLSRDENKLMLDMAKELHNESEVCDIKKRYEHIEKEDFFKTCTEHDLAGVVGYFAKSIGLELPNYWEKEYFKQEYRQNILKEKAKEITALMCSAGIPMVILKNGGIMLGMVPDAVKCPMEDIDSLIRKTDFYKAHEILIKNGFSFKFRSEFEEDKLDEAYRHGSAEYYFILPDGDKMWFELSWRAIDGRWIRPDLEPDTDGFICRSYIAKGTNAHILSPEDNLLQVCIHMAKHSYCRAPGLRLHMDVDRIVAHNQINWEAFLEKVYATHVRTSTYISLFIPSILFNTKIPQTVLEELKTRKSDRILYLLGKAGLLHPKERKFNKLEFLRFQILLYDTRFDILKVLYPGKEWMNQRYSCTNAAARLVSTVERGLDLIGIRKEK